MIAKDRRMLCVARNPRFTNREYKLADKSCFQNVCVSLEVREKHSSERNPEKFSF
jgi:hypothetical protein